VGRSATCTAPIVGSTSKTFCAGVNCAARKTIAVIRAIETPALRNFGLGFIATSGGRYASHATIAEYNVSVKLQIAIAKMNQRHILRIIILIELTACVFLTAVLTYLVRSLNTTPNPAPVAIRVTHTPAPLATLKPPSTTVIATITLMPTMTLKKYKVALGDTLWDIALRFNVPLERLIATNPNIDPDKLIVGQVLIIPNPIEPLPMPTATKTNTASFSALTASPSPSPNLSSRQYPFVSSISANAREIFLRGQKLGNRRDVFSKVGDSITVAPVYLTPIGQGKYNLHTYNDLESVIQYFSQTAARDGNSFVNTSLTAKGGWSAWTVLNFYAADKRYCLPDEMPLVCEYRIVKPSVAIIMLGTTDVEQTTDRVYERYMRQTIEVSINMGVIPILSTIPAYHRTAFDKRVPTINSILFKLAKEYDVPVMDYWGSLRGRANDGLSSDGVHPSNPPNGDAADFTSEALEYGFTVRNLLTLQALDAVWRNVLK